MGASELVQYRAYEDVPNKTVTTSRLRTAA